MGLFDLFFGKRKKDIGESINYDGYENNRQTTNNGDYDFVFEVEDVFSVAGRGTVATGRILKGKVVVGEEVMIANTGKTVTITGIEMFRKMLNEAIEGDNVGLLLSDVSRDEVERGFTLKK